MDLMWRPLSRLAYIGCCLSDAFCDLSGHTCCMGTVDMDIYGCCVVVVIMSCPMPSSGACIPVRSFFG